MNLWIDADACPNQVKEIMFKAANRKKIQLTLVANQYIKIPNSPFISMTQVESGFDVADDYIVAHVEPNDLVITSDIPLADELITKGAQVLTSRGEAFTPQNIKQKLNIRDFMETMRSSGIQSGGPPPLNAQDIQQFANALDRYLSKV
ncbi:MAG: YaiI/YqxD family protein [Saccharospirillaceae bacterium]|nr:YaiI/YqxD family protein [Pseudomonadales bacterium]NRB81031.1 YaiI/YqxD family protein [Saccharospirillaceae bacterium]